jgi:hypothetical protein
MLDLINPAQIEPWRARFGPLLPRFCEFGINACSRTIVDTWCSETFWPPPFGYAWCLNPIYIRRSILVAGWEWVEVSWAALGMGSKWDIGGKVAAVLGLVEPLLNERANNDINGANIEKGQQATTVPSQLSWNGTLLNNGMIIKFPLKYDRLREMGRLVPERG